MVKRRKTKQGIPKAAPQNSAKNSRVVVLAALTAVREGKSLPDALAQAGGGRLEERDRAFARRLALHAVRHRRRLEDSVFALLDKPPKPGVLSDLLWLGAAQLDLPDIAEYAAVNSTVDLAPKRIRGVVNAILRRRLREGEVEAQSLAQRESFPDWLCQKIQADWAEQAGDVLQALNQDLPLCLRVNAQRYTRDEYQALLLEQGLELEPVLSSGLRLTKSVSIEALPAYAEGAVSVQGVAAQAAVELLGASGEQKVLDACAAPGGKTAHMLERAPDLQVTAVDIDEQRLSRVEENLQRLGLQAELLAGDLTEPGDWEGPFERVLLDAPCSGTGVIARHPDIKWLRRESDLVALNHLQGELLESCWQRLQPGGELLYCTCSILTAENDAVIERFLQQHPEAKPQPIELPFGQASEYGWRVAPQVGLEGFYYARLLKQK